MKVVYRKSMLERLMEFKPKAEDDGLEIDHVVLSELEHEELKNNLRRSARAVEWTALDDELIFVYGIQVKRERK